MMANKAISLTQPWASLVMTGAKRWETRSWRTRYVGDIVICASKGYPRDCRELLQSSANCAARTFRDGVGHLYDPDALPIGVALGIALLRGCLSTNDRDYVKKAADLGVPHAPREVLFGNYGSDRWIWLLDHIRPFEKPIPVKGSLGIFSLPADFVEAGQ